MKSERKKATWNHSLIVRKIKNVEMISMMNANALANIKRINMIKIGSFSNSLYSDVI